jgi:hypothetical protein
LGYEIATLNNDHKLDRRGRRTINAQIGLRVPVEVVRTKCAPYLKGGEPIHRAERINDSAFSIESPSSSRSFGASPNTTGWPTISTYSKDLSGSWRTLVDQDVGAQTAHQSVKQVYRRLQTTIKTDTGARKVLRVEVSSGEEKRSRW